MPAARQPAARAASVMAPTAAPVASASWRSGPAPRRRCCCGPGSGSSSAAGDNFATASARSTVRATASSVRVPVLALPCRPSLRTRTATQAVPRSTFCTGCSWVKRLSASSSAWTVTSASSLPARAARRRACSARRLARAGSSMRTSCAACGALSAFRGCRSLAGRVRAGRTRNGQAGERSVILGAAPGCIMRSMSRVPPALVIATSLFIPVAVLHGQDAGVSAPPGDAASPRVSLDGRWDLLLDREDTGVTRGLQAGSGPGWDRPLKVAVPGPLESNTQASDYDGVAWYRCVLPAAHVPPGGHLLLQFDDVDWRADAWLDGQLLGRHDGPGVFRFDVTGKLETAGRTLVLRIVDPGDKQVDGLLLSGLPSGRQAWFYDVGRLLGAVDLVQAGRAAEHTAELQP